MIRTVSIALLLLLCLPSALRAEEAKAPDVSGAAEVGRGLLSPDPAVRAKARADLIARIRSGRDIEAYVRAMGEALAEWADEHERLLEIWLHEAVHGNAEERERAVHLLAALGPEAVRRLALELRHARQHEGGAPQTDAERPVADAPQKAEPELTPVLPRIYVINDIEGLNAFQVRSLMLAAADATSVKSIKGGRYVVTATAKGHEALYRRLEELRAPPPQDAEASPAAAEDGAAPAPAPSSPAEPAQASPAEPAQASPAEPAQASPAEPAQASPAEPAQAGDEAPANTWRIEPLLVHLPGRIAAGLPGLTGAPADYDQAHVGTAGDGRRWAAAVRNQPDARAALPYGYGAAASETIAVGGSTRLFSGRHVEYSKDVTRTKGGAWRVSTGSIPHGIELVLALTTEDGTLVLDLRATRTDVGLPMPRVRVRPSENAAPVELDRPEWSTVRLRERFPIAPDGAGLFVPLDGLAQPGEERIVAVITIK